MAQRRYRIRFIAHIDHTIAAEDDVGARQIADELQALPGQFIADGEAAELRWNTIELLGE